MPGLSKDIQRQERHHTPSYSCKITRSDTRPHIKLERMGIL